MAKYSRHDPRNKKANSKKKSMEKDRRIREAGRTKKFNKALAIKKGYWYEDSELSDS